MTTNEDGFVEGIKLSSSTSDVEAIQPSSSPSNKVGGDVAVINETSLSSTEGATDEDIQPSYSSDVETDQLSSATKVGDDVVASESSFSTRNELGADDEAIQPSLSSDVGTTRSSASTTEVGNGVKVNELSYTNEGADDECTHSPSSISNVEVTCTTAENGKGDIEANYCRCHHGCLPAIDSYHEEPHLPTDPPPPYSDFLRERNESVIIEQSSQQDVQKVLCCFGSYTSIL